MAFSQILPDEKKESAVAFLRAAVAYYASLGVTVARVMTDNGSCYRSHGLRQGLRRARPEAHLHQALHAQDQRQGRALHPDRAARMGLRQGLSNLRPPRRRAARLAAPLQLASAPRRDKITDTNQPTRPDQDNLLRLHS